VKDKQSLPLIGQPPCYSYIKDMLNATISTQAQITYIRHQPSYTQLGVKMKRAWFLYGTRNGHHNTELQTLRQIIVQNAQNEPTILNHQGKQTTLGTSRQQSTNNDEQQGPIG
jgi:hypothetical protein